MSGVNTIRIAIILYIKKKSENIYVLLYDTVAFSVNNGCYSTHTVCYSILQYVYSMYSDIVVMFRK